MKNGTLNVEQKENTGYRIRADEDVYLSHAIDPEKTERFLYSNEELRERREQSRKQWSR